MRSISHWTPRYVIDRLSVALFRKKYSEDLPNFAVGAIQFLEGYLSKNDRVFEYGAGYSTAWFAKIVRSIISVESNKGWYDLVINKLKPFDNAQIFLMDSKENITHLAPYEEVAISWSYVNKIKDYEIESFDFILNDGYVRPLVPQVALAYLKKGGIFCWDDIGGYFPIERSYAPEGMKPSGKLLKENRDFLEMVKGWRRVIFDDGVHTTGLFFKPL